MVLVTEFLIFYCLFYLERDGGLFGILFATLVSRALTNLWYDPYAVYKHGLFISPIRYLKKVFKVFIYCCRNAGINLGSVFHCSGRRYHYVYNKINYMYMYS